MIKGAWFETDSSAKVLAELYLSDNSFQIRSGEKVIYSGDLKQLSFSDRVGSIDRKVYIQDQGVFQTAENDTIDQWLKYSQKAQHSRASSWFHRLETHWGMIISSAVIVAFLTVVMFVWGLPAGSKYVAKALPSSFAETLSTHTLEVMDKALFKPSELTDEKQVKIIDHFDKELTQVYSGEHNLKLHFRNVGGLANAFALPSGDIVLTDELVDRLQAPGQLDSVILHEIGHVHYHHGMTRLVHSSAIGVLLLAIMGNDEALLQELLVSFPVFLMQQHYSREAEIEADEFAFEKMIELGIDPIRFAEALELIIAEDGDSNANSQHEEPASKVKEYSQYLSTHPETKERMAAAKRYLQQHAE
ncbi:M48 family metallopeptidase [Neptuniibacter sp. QD57_21]|uniref:M48 family metallopeptidase n=1 Tax=Neptuniibacter sp. QD57_21 TaxID=3398213 RepID=UPI0039F64720